MNDHLIPLFETVAQRSELLSLSNESASHVALAIRNALTTLLSPEALAGTHAFLEDPKNTQSPVRIVYHRNQPVSLCFARFQVGFWLGKTSPGEAR